MRRDSAGPRVDDRGHGAVARRPVLQGGVAPRRPKAPPVERFVRIEATTVNTSWDGLFDAVFGVRGSAGNLSHPLVERVRAALWDAHFATRTLQSEALYDTLAIDVVSVLAAARAGRVAVDVTTVADLAAAGEAWARHGLPVDEMLRAWHVGVDVVVGHVRESAGALGVDDTDLLEFVQSAVAWSDVAVVAAAKGHRSAEIALAIAEEERRAAFVRGVLFGTFPSADLRVSAEAYGLDPTREYVAVRARLSDGSQQRKLEQALGFHQQIGQHRRGLCAVVDGAVAGILVEPPESGVDGIVGVGPVRPLKYLAESYRLATRALMTVQACGLRGAHDMASLGLKAAVAMDTDVGDILRARYLDPLSDGDSARELIATLRAYLACDLHVERTATRLFVHQNTVRYRLARFEELTGANLRETQVVFEVWWALALTEMSL